MNTGRYVLSQILDLVDRKTLARLVERYGLYSFGSLTGTLTKFKSLTSILLLKPLISCILQLRLYLTTGHP